MAASPRADVNAEVRTDDDEVADVSPDGRPDLDPQTGDVEPDPARLSSMIDRISETGRDPNVGISRLAFSESEREAHELVGSWLSDLGLKVWSDAVGNTLAELPGERDDAPAIGTGSHLDSVPHGGRFDGVAGVATAVEVARLLVENDLRLQRPLRVVAFAAEEGARFGEPCIGSKAVTGRWDARSFDRMRDRDRVSAAEAMRSVGLRPDRIESCRWDPEDWAGFIELHVEQGKVLETSGRSIGLVDMVSGSTRVEFSLTGTAQHTGATPMRLRADALAAASEIVLFAEELAHDPHYRGARATVGQLDVFPNSITTIPGEVRFVLDMRDIDSDRQRQAAWEVAQAADHICERREVGCSFEVIADSSPAVLPMWVREITTAVCEDLGLEYRVMTSGASHDAQFVNRIVPTAMLFVPSKAGLSHVPEEWTSATDLAAGTTVLLESVLRLDRFLTRLSSTDAEKG